MMAQAATQQTAAQRRALGLKQLFEAAFKSPALGKVGGNLLIYVPNVATWTLVTEGPMPGLKDHASEDEIHFALSCDDFLLVQLMTGADVDFQACVNDGRLKLQGDVDIFLRFIDCIPA